MGRDQAKENGKALMSEENLKILCFLSTLLNI